MAGTWQIAPQKCLKILAVVRSCARTRKFAWLAVEMHLRSLQPLALHVVNSFLGDYLTSEGQAAKADLDMIADAGFTVLGAAPGGNAPTSSAEVEPELARKGGLGLEPALRRRGAGARRWLTV